MEPKYHWSAMKQWQNEAIFEFINVTNIPTDTYVSMKGKRVDVLLYYVVSLILVYSLNSVRTWVFF